MWISKGQARLALVPLDTFSRPFEPIPRLYRLESSRPVHWTPYGLGSLRGQCTGRISQPRMLSLRIVSLLLSPRNRASFLSLRPACLHFN